jgi:hypothetical protein
MCAAVPCTGRNGPARHVAGEGRAASAVGGEGERTLSERGKCRLHLQGRKIIWERNQVESRRQASWFLAQLIFLTLKMEAIYSSETSVDTQLTTRRYIPEDGTCHLLLRWFIAQLIFLPWKWRRYIPPKRRLTLNGLHGVISQKMVHATCFHAGLLLSLIFQPSRWRRYVPSKRRFTLNGLHGVISKKMVHATCFRAGLMASLFFRPCRWGRYVPPKRRLTLNGIHGVISQKMVHATCFHAGLLLSLFFQPWRWGRYVPPKRRLTLNGIHGAISKKMLLFRLFFPSHKYLAIYDRDVIEHAYRPSCKMLLLLYDIKKHWNEVTYFSKPTKY